MTSHASGYLFRRDPVWGCDRLVSRAKVMAILVILISSDSLDESVGPSPSWIILFDTILAEIPTETPTIPSVVPDLYEVTVAWWRSRVAARSSPPPSPTHNLSSTDVTPPTLRQILPAPPGHLASRYPPNHSSSDHFLSDDSSSDSSLDSSSDYSSDFSSGHSLPDSSVDAPATIFARPSRKRCRSPFVSVSLATPILGALSPIRADLLPPRKRIRGVVTTSDYDDSIEESYEAYTEPDIDSDVQADIDVDAEATATREVDVGVEVGIRSDREDEVEEEAESVDRVSGELELVLLCTKMVPVEEDKVKKFIRVLPDNIQGNVITTEPIRLQDVIRIANNLMDQKLKGYAARNAENKRRFKNNLRDNRVKQQPFKRQNVARAYTVGNSEKKGC
ncbi:hypothetical protein Tco_0257485 [Tanacetum coccineum]